jgi:hypothetical protein
MVVIARSLPLILRVMISVQAQANAETIENNAAGWNALEPGRRMISTPIRPTAEKHDRQCSDEQWRHEAGGGRLRDREKPQAGDEEQRRPHQRNAS